MLEDRQFGVERHRFWAVAFSMHGARQPLNAVPMLRPGPPGPAIGGADELSTRAASDSSASASRASGVNIISSASVQAVAAGPLTARPNDCLLKM